MNSLGELFRRVCALFQKEKLDRDMDEELRFHIERQTEANIGAGMKSEEARYAALVASGRTIPWADMQRHLKDRAAGEKVTRPAAKKLAS